jgi:Domain of unknown function (DUF4145)
MSKPKTELRFAQSLPLDRCPNCGIAKPNLQRVAVQKTEAPGVAIKSWALYTCTVCADVVLAGAPSDGAVITKLLPECESIDDAIPDRASDYLRQALDSKHAPIAAVIMAASSVDAMLKAKGLKTGSLNERIELAKKQNLLTEDMAAWAHDIRLDANAQRHADESDPIPNAADAERVIEFAKALGQFLFVLPAAVKHGRAIPGGITTTTTTT